MKQDDEIENIVEVEGTLDDGSSGKDELAVEIRVISMADIYENLEQLSDFLVEQVQFAISDLNLENIAQAKRVVSSAKGIITALDSRRIALKKEILKPYDQIEQKIKVIKERINVTIVPLEKAISKAEETRVQERDELIRVLKHERFAQENDALEAFLRKCEWLNNSSWYNKGYTNKKISEEIDKRCCDVISDLAALDILNDGNPHAAALALNYQQQGNLGKAIALRKQLEEAERNHQNRINACRPVELLETENRPRGSILEDTFSPPQSLNPTEIVHFRAELDRPKTIKLTGFMRSEHIKFGIIKEVNR
jgi:hypothetical protein